MIIFIIFVTILRMSMRILMAMTSPFEEKATGGVNICRLLPTPSNQPPNMMCAMIVMITPRMIMIIKMILIMDTK